MRNRATVSRGRPWAVVAGCILAACAASGSARACTTAVITGKATADGRPLLWKSRDLKSLPRNEVAVWQGEKHRVLAVVNDDDRDQAWMGVNSAGFCIENSLSRDLDVEGKHKGPGNGGLIKLALETCATIEDFRQLLERTNATGRKTDGNFGVIDAAGGAALFEAGPTSFQMFDANDPAIAPRGYIVRSNFATTAQGVGPAPDPESLQVKYSGERYVRACRLIESRRGADLDVGFLLRNVCRDLANPKGVPFAGTVNGPAGDPPQTVSTASTISRTTTVSAGVFHGVKPGEDPLLTTMWVVLGDPKFSIAVPCWVSIEKLSDAVTGEKGGPICSIATTLREWNLTEDRDGVHTGQLKQIWDDVWPVEGRLIDQVADLRLRWATSSASPADFTEAHQRLATQALEAMRGELVDMKEAALARPTPTPPEFPPAPFSPALAP